MLPFRWWGRIKLIFANKRKLQIGLLRKGHNEQKPADISATKTRSYPCEVKEVLYRLLGICSRISILEIMRSVNTTRINGSIKIWRRARPCAKILYWGKKFSWNPSEVRDKCSDQVWKFLLIKILTMGISWRS